MFSCETNQEVLDTIIQAYKIAEDESVMLPVLINMDGFIHSFTREAVELPSEKSIDSFLPKYKPVAKLDVNAPASLGVPVMSEYMYFKSQQHKAMHNAESLIRKVDEQWKKKFRRRYGLVERFHMDDADYVLVTMGANSTIAKTAVTELRAEGEKAGLLRLRVIRPWPAEEISSALQNAKRIAVCDQSIAPGAGGLLYPEIKSCLKHGASVTDFIMGLGGRTITKEDFKAIYKRLKEDDTPKQTWLMD